MVLILGSIETLGFDGAVSGVRRRSSQTWPIAWDYCMIKYKVKLLNDLISVTHFYCLLYWANMGFDKSLDNYVRVRLVCKNHWSSYSRPTQSRKKAPRTPQPGGRPGKKWATKSDWVLLSRYIKTPTRTEFTKNWFHTFHLSVFVFI